MSPVKGIHGENLYSEQEIRRMNDDTMMAMAIDALTAMSKMGDRLEAVLPPSARTNSGSTRTGGISK